MNYERKLASFRVIKSLDPIPGADAIETATVDGWKVVVKKGQYKVGDTVIYIEVDSWVPLPLAPFLQRGTTTHEYGGVVGNRLRTIRLRGQISQGLILPMSILNPPECFVPDYSVDLSGLMNIQKWEKPVPAQLSGVAKGAFPSFIPKTDEPRIQNLFDEIDPDALFDVTEKLDGTSMTVYWNEGVFGVCSRNLDLLDTEGNSLWATAKRLNLEYSMAELNRNIAIQGELVGPGIQKNPYGLIELKFFVFNIWDIDNRTYLPLFEVRKLCTDLERLDMVPYIGIFAMDSLDNLLGFAETRSKVGTCPAEGLVFRDIDNPNMSFKVISNSWLLGEK